MGYVSRKRKRAGPSHLTQTTQDISQPSSTSALDTFVSIKLVCENHGCLDLALDLPYRSKYFNSDKEMELEALGIEREVNVEELMNLLNLSVMDH